MPICKGHPDSSGVHDERVTYDSKVNKATLLFLFLGCSSL